MMRRNGTIGLQMLMCVMIVIFSLISSGLLVNAYSPYLEENASIQTQAAEGYFGVSLKDSMTHEQLTNATIAVYDEQWNFQGYCQRTDTGILASPRSISAGRTVFLAAWDDNHYPKTIQWEMPDFQQSNTNYIPLDMEIFTRCENATAQVISPIGTTFPINTTEYGMVGMLTIIFNMFEENSRYGADWYDANTGRYYEGPWLVLRSTIQQPITGYYKMTASSTYFYYYFDIEEIYNDVDNPTDGQASFNIYFDYIENGEMSIAFIDTLWNDMLSSGVHFNGDTITYSNGILNTTGNSIKINNGFNPTYVYPPYYIEVDDLFVDFDGGGDDDFGEPLPTWNNELLRTPVFKALLFFGGCVLLVIIINELVVAPRRRINIERGEGLRRTDPIKENIDETTFMRDVKNETKQKTTINDANHTTDDDDTYYGYRG